MTARRPVPTTTLQLLAPPAPARPPARRVDGRQVIDLTVRADNRLLLSVEEAAERLGIGRSLMYELISSGQVASIRVGRLRRIVPEALSAYVADLRAPPAVIDPARRRERLRCLEPAGASHINGTAGRPTCW